MSEKLVKRIFLLGFLIFLFIAAGVGVFFGIYLVLFREYQFIALIVISVIVFISAGYFNVQVIKDLIKILKERSEREEHTIDKKLLITAIGFALGALILYIVVRFTNRIFWLYPILMTLTIILIVLCLLSILIMILETRRAKNEEKEDVSL